ncbi:myo-inositol-1(or 4)-monophosphatase [Jatrophihabitans sp. GAS493]|uniref:inositol monophosphatase family protein n=1 Tax=Jatrophihabitans sp. GAS493 TaxID=1907575 RepID=UPI000BB8BF51|nr:inositol monophosphatase family protein [Jatrophihabitans sp. GAS493]SOD74089.1 myo-inositol-1(or 4)-monophosphatase [Jatrophihabitans sp. GAS493]
MGLPADPPETSELKLPDLGRLVVELAVGAGEVIRRRLYPNGEFDRSALQVSSKSTPTDVVTQVDVEVETWLVRAIRAVRPSDVILGEEGGAHDAGRAVGEPTGHVRWVIDPIDGTVNFVHGLPRFAVSIAVEVGGRTEVGCVHNPISGEVYSAVRGEGAWLHRVATRADVALRSADFGRRRLRGPAAVPLAAALVGTGFAYERGRRARQAAVVSQLMAEVADIRRMGAASLDLCSLADGELDAYFEAGLSPWDYAAGEFIAREAGCVISGLDGLDGLDGSGASTTMTAGCGPELADDFFRLLRRIGAAEV